MKGTFNIRVYGILIEDEKLLLIREPYAGNQLVKFPGGGLNFGEGLVNCLKREFLEELSLELSQVEHAYTTDFFQASAFRENEQLINVYYDVKINNINQLKVADPEIEELIWISISDITEESVSLPVDKKMVQIIKQRNKKN